jgi:hypothetical protein
MKQILLTFFTVLTVNSYGQVLPYLRAITFNSNVYRTIDEFKLTKFSELNGKPVATEEVILKPKTGKSIRYKIVGIDGDYTIIKLLPRLQQSFESSTKLNLIQVVDDAPSVDDASKFLYFVKTKDILPNRKIVLSEKIIGTPLIFPFKLRTQDRGDGATISTEFTVGYTFGLRLKLSKQPYKQNFLTLVPYGFGLGSSKYFYKKDDGSYSSKTDGVAVSYYTGGLMLTSNKINFGLFAGKDAMIDKQNNWAYQGQWWFSFGLGFKFKAD